MMKRKFYTDFEKHLKENADEFKMYPSKKIWHGLYNDLHPGKRWPSAAMSIFFLFVLVILGHLNTGKDLRSHIASTTPAEITPNRITDKPLKVVSKAHQTRVNEVTSSQDLSADENGSPVTDATVTDKSSEQNITSAVTYEINKKQIAISPIVTPPSAKMAEQSGKHDENNADENKPAKIMSDFNQSNLTISNSPRIEEKPIAEKKITEKNKVTPKSSELTEEEKQLILLAALKQKRREHISWTYYITPSISYRNLMEEVVVPGTVASGPMMAASRDMQSSVDQKPFIGLELGTSLNYKLSEKLKVKSGLQLNYSNYSIKANNTHPTQAELILNSSTTGTPYTLSTVSLYGNKTGVSEVTLHNYSLQVSAPVGLEYELGGNENMQFSVAATFQPSFVIKDKSYVLSTNKLNYLTDKSLMRRWNMTTNIGAFVSFQSNSFRWQIGPQLHYQLKSTYTGNYPVQEHLIDYGIRIGVSKLLQ